MSRRRRVSLDTIPDGVLVGLCEGFLEQDWNAERAAQWLRDQTPSIDVGRTRVYGLLGEAKRRGLIRLQVRSAGTLEERLARVLGLDRDRLRVVDASGPVTGDQVAHRGAQMTLEVVRALAEATDYDLLRIGLGGGHTLRRVSTHLAEMLRREATDRPRLAVHALSSGFDPRVPQNAPITFLGMFESVADELVGLFTSGVYEHDDAQRLRDQPGVAESFRLARKIDVVVTSLASARDRTGPLYRFLSQPGRPELEQSRRQLLELGWVGDVLYEPYGDDGPIGAELPVQPVSLIKLRELRSLARHDQKAVVLVVGPSESGRSKADALVPVLTRPSLRVWSHLVVDSGTAVDVLRQLEAS
jgi:DNA-binding transcriptional regulator LsrR (DeoR family)